ncbi:protein of unknown function [Candidatus Hydrogenisulfobacillus filiaventi]|uniref:Uncharacterized protein n=1 Tax=Candidatus Hydrogenisulfobacillus filiaventi TaxID=2707344 RepID=A0A6F8ZKK2_9FIRM|nr:protein of unknown function [Candidatus Hydrogenisulfobacillus filiaventi]
MNISQKFNNFIQQDQHANGRPVLPLPRLLAYGPLLRCCVVYHPAPPYRSEGTGPDSPGGEARPGRTLPVGRASVLTPGS